MRPGPIGFCNIATAVPDLPGGENPAIRHRPDPVAL